MENVKSGDWGAATAQIEANMKETVKRQQDTQESVLPNNAPDVVAAAVREIEEHLPKTAPETISFLNKYLGMTPQTRLESRVKAAVVERIRKHYRDLSNGLKPVDVLEAAHTERNIQADTVANGPARRVARSVVLRTLNNDLLDQIAVVIQGEGDSLGVSYCPEPVAVEPITLICKHSPRFNASMTMARTLLSEWEIQRLENFDLLYPQERSKELQRELESAPSHVVADLRLKITALRQPETDDIRSRAKRELNTFFAQFVDELGHLKATAVETLEQVRNVALIHEEQFFAKFGLTTETTSVSRRYDAAIAKVKAIQPSTDALKLFGVDDLKQ